MTHPDTTPALAQLLSWAERSVARRLTRIVEEHGSTVERWRVLSLLADGCGHPMKEVADHAMVPGPTLTRIIDAMITDTLVYRRVDPDDRRRVLVFASARGRRLHARLKQDIDRYEASIATADADLDIPALTTLLAQLVDRVE